MKCPICRSEISIMANVCPCCTSDLGQYYSQHGGDISPLQPLIDFSVLLVMHTLLLYVPLSILVIIFLKDMKYYEIAQFIFEYWFYASVILAIVFRKKLPVF